MSTPMMMIREVHDQITETVGKLPAETGGLLAGRLNGPITHYFFDVSGRRGRSAYSPDTEAVNQKLKEWPDDVRLRGFVHSHPVGYTQPSSADIEYAARMLSHNRSLPRLVLPIVQSAADTGSFEMYGFQVELKSGRPKVSGVTIGIEDDPTALPPAKIVSHPDMFERVRGSAYDVDRLSSSLVIMAGVGGGASFVDSLARTGVGHFVLIDPDTVSVTNLATQGYYRRDLGRPKVDALAERIQAINPEAVVHAHAKRLEDVPIGEISRALFAERYPAVLLVAMTDSFPAQAVANQIALSLRLPLLTAQLYAEGRGAEIVYQVPGVTPSCMRCVLSSRYGAYAGAQVRPVTSVGSPICSGEALNASATALAMAILHHGTKHPRWGNIISRAGKRNFLQMRFDPDIESTLGLSIFDRVLGREQTPELFFGETIWRAVDPDNPQNGFPHCPDCGGTGDLLNPAPGICSSE